MTLSPSSALDRDEGEVGELQLAGELGELGADLVEALLAPVDEVHLVHAHGEVADAQERRDHCVAPALLDEALAGVDQHEGEVGRGGTGHHVPGVLGVARGVGDDELAARRREVAVRHIDRDALLALGPQAVGEQRQVRVLEALVAARALDGLELVLEDVLALVEQAADEGALAVVDRTGGGEPEQLHQKYPSFLRSSMAASVNLSSARVAPRSVTREAATSVITSSIVIAALSTAPVQLASPTVR